MYSHCYNLGVQVGNCSGHSRMKTEFANKLAGDSRGYSTVIRMVRYGHH